MFSVIHGLGVALDPFTAFRWHELLVPSFSHYQPLWMGFGIVALYLGIGTGSDTNTGFGIALYAASFLTVLFLSVWRIASSDGLSPLARSGAVMFALLLTVAGGIGTAAGPLKSGWNAIANNHQGSGTRLALATTVSSATVHSFQATLDCTQSTVPQTGNVSIVLHCTLSQGPAATC